MTIVVWNTGRLYTNNNQRILAIQLEFGQTAFVDIDRNISAIVPCACEMRTVMAAYDYNIGMRHVPAELGRCLERLAQTHCPKPDGPDYISEYPRSIIVDDPELKRLVEERSNRVKR